MLPKNYSRMRLTMAYASHKPWLCIIFAFVLLPFSCSKKPSVNTEENSHEFKLINDTVVKFNSTKRPKEAVRYLDSAYSKISNPTLKDRISYYQFKFMYNKRIAHDTKRELLYADSMMTMAVKFTTLNKYVYNYAYSNFAKGDAYFDLNRYTDAYRFYYEGYILGKNYLDNSLLAEYTYRMGMITYRQSHYRLAADYFKDSYKQSFAYSDDFRAFYQRQELLNNIGESYMHDGDADSAAVYYNKALVYIDSNYTRFKDVAYRLDIARAVIWGDQGEVMLNKGQYAQAKVLLEQSIAVNLKRSYDNYNAELAEVSLGNLYLKQHQSKPLYTLLQNLHRQIDTVKNMEAQTNWNWLMSGYYEQKNDYFNTYNYYKRYCSLKDSLNKVDLSIKETDINQQVANYDKQYQIQTLKDNNKIQKIYLYLAIVCFMLSIAIILLVYRYWERSKRDISAISELNEQINSQKTDLETTLDNLKVNGQEKDRILRTVAHDLRNPIGGIVSLTNIMLHDEYNEEQKQLISLVNDTSRNSLELINEILEATNNSNGKLNKELVDINALVNNSVEILNFKAAEKDQKIITELLEETEKVLISREKIWRVISNLVSNAIKFSPNNSTIRVKITNEKNKIQISVADNGIGIPDDIKDEVFNMFTNATRLGTAGEKSFGLGLSICQQIIENHNGKIWFESDVAKGTTFYISLNKPKA
jgi:two-component system, OmpR family, sensor histidine kinase VicK